MDFATVDNIATRHARTVGLYERVFSLRCEGVGIDLPLETAIDVSASATVRMRSRC